MIFSKFFTGVLFIILGITANAMASSDKKVLIQFKPTGKTLNFTVQRSSEIFETSWDRKRQQSTFDGKNVFKYKLTPNKQGYIDVKSLLVSSRKSVNGKLLNEGKPQSQVKNVYSIENNGKRIHESNSPESSDLALQFPNKEIGEGDTWKVSLPPSENYPAKIDMFFQVKKLTRKSGKLLAVINNKYEDSGFFEERGCRASIKGKNRILFNVTDGHILRQSGTSEFIITWVAKGENTPFQSSTFSRMKLTVR